MKTREKKEMELEDAPSGYVTLYNYKEPFMPFKSGFGYEGVLLFDGESDKVQCHFCGNWYDYLPAHIPLHGFKASEYKKEVGLRQNTALISESHREKLVANRDISIKNLQKGKKHKKENIAKISKTVKENRSTREQQNEKGTCPEQLLDRLRKCAEELGHVPNKWEFPAYATTVRMYGTWRKAVRLAGYKPRKPGQNIGRHQTRKHTKESLITVMKEFTKRHNRMPVQTDYRRRLIPSPDTLVRHFGSWENLLKALK